MKFFAMVMASWTLSGCLFLHSYKVNEDPSIYSLRGGGVVVTNPSRDISSRPPTRSGWSHHFLFGLFTAPAEPVESTWICQKLPIATIVDYMAFYQALIGLVTVGIYTPTTWEVTCGSPPPGEPVRPPQ